MIRLLAATLMLAAGLPAFAQKTAADIPVQSFFRLPQFNNMELSPNGERLAAESPLNGRANLVVVDLGKRTRTVITNFKTLDVVQPFWLNNDRLCFGVADGQEATGNIRLLGVYCIDHDGNDQRDITAIAGERGVSVSGLQVQALGPARDGTADLIVMMNLRTRGAYDAYRLNTKTGRNRILTFDSPGDVVSWIVDRKNVARVAVSVPERKGSAPQTRTVWYRDGEDSKWEPIARTELIGQWPNADDFVPLAFDYDNTTLYVAANPGRDKRAIYKYDTKARKLGELVYEHPLVDAYESSDRSGHASKLVFDHERKKLAGVRVNAEKPGAVWFDADLDRLQKSLDATFKGGIVELRLPAESSKRALVHVYSDVDPGEYFLMDRTKPSVESIARTREWLDPKLMSERRFITYKARDGMEIPAWVTIPRGSSGKDLPLIVHVHGGPWVRAYTGVAWGRWPDAQFFASRGYVVLEPEPRGSTGFGRKHFASSFKQWGQAMQDDITDGALHLVKEGIVDKGRMCLHGGSYGGYAAAMGLVKDPDLWRCASPFIAVTDLTIWQRLNTSDIAQGSDFFQTDFKRLVGDASADREMFMRTSPAQQADKIKAPVLLTMGSDDVRVPLPLGEALRNALEAQGKKVEWVVYKGEGHGYNKEENVVDFYSRLEKFFAEHLKK